MNAQRNHLFCLAALALIALVSLACGSTTPTTVQETSMATPEPQVTHAPANTAEPAKATDTLVPTDTPLPTDTPVPTDTPLPPPTDTPVPELYLGDAATDNSYALTGISVQDPATPGMLHTATSGKKLIAVDVIISNLAGEVLHVNPLNATLVDREGFVYQPELGGVDDQIPTLDLNPGEKARGLIAFEVPESASAASIKYAIETFGDNFLQASLVPAPETHTAVAEPPSTPAEPLPALRDVVEDLGYSLAATSVEDPAAPGILYQQKQGYKLVAIEIVLSNVSGSQPLSVNPLYAFLVDDEGFVYSPELGGREDQIATGELGSGEKARGWVAFEIPDTATPASIKYATELFSDNYLHTGVTE